MTKEIYRVYKNKLGEIHSERRTVIYENDDYFYCKVPGSNKLLDVSKDRVFCKFKPQNAIDFVSGKISEGYFEEEPEMEYFNKDTVIDLIDYYARLLAEVHDFCDAFNDLYRALKEKEKN